MGKIILVLNKDGKKFKVSGVRRCFAGKVLTDDQFNELIEAGEIVEEVKK